MKGWRFASAEAESLVARIDALGGGPEAAALFCTISQWLLQESTLDRTLLELYGVEKIASLDSTRYHFGSGISDILGDLAFLRAGKLRSEEAFVMALRDVLWTLVRFLSRVVCPNCEGAELAVVWDTANEERVLLWCALCDWLQDRNGKEQFDSELAPLPADLLRRYGYIG